jgi:hypothetical protein
MDMSKTGKGDFGIRYPDIDPQAKGVFDLMFGFLFDRRETDVTRA